MRNVRLKKIIVAMIGLVLEISLLSCVFLSSCGEALKEVGAPEKGKTYTVSDERLYYLSLDLSQYVSFTYSGLKITIPVVTVDDQEIEQRLKELGKSQATFSTTKKVDQNDVVVCRIVGYSEGKAVLSSNEAQFDMSEIDETFPGIAEALIGTVPGNTVTVKSVFPKDYSVEKYAGKELSLEISVNYVMSYEMNDEIVQKYTSGACKTVAEYRQKIYDMLYKEKFREVAQDVLWETLRKEAVIEKYPEGDLEYYYHLYVEWIMSLTPNLSYEEALKQYGLTDDGIRQIAEESCIQNLLFYFIAQKEEIRVYEADYQATLNEYVEDYVWSVLSSEKKLITRDEAIAIVEKNPEEIISASLEDKVFSYLLDHNTFIQQD